MIYPLAFTQLGGPFVEAVKPNGLRTALSALFKNPQLFWAQVAVSCSP